MPSPRAALALLAILSASSPALGFQAKRAMTVDDLLAVKGVGDPQVSPDGKLVVYTVSELNRDTGKSNSDLWLVPTAGGEPRRLTTAPGADNHPRWSPDGKAIAFVSTRSGSSQIWLLPLDGGEATQLTKLPIDVDGPIWSPKGDKIAFVASVYGEESDTHGHITPSEWVTAQKDKQKAESKSQAKVFDHLMIRHWQSWNDGKYSHLFVCDARTGEAKDLIPRWKANVPPGPFGGSSDYAWSLDGQSLAFTSEPLTDSATSTNTDIWLIPAEGGEAKNLTGANKGADAQPAFSDSGLAYLSQARAGFEADQWVLKVIAPDKPDEVFTPLLTFDRPIVSFVRADNYDSFLVVVDDQGSESIMEVYPTAVARLRRTQTQQLKNAQEYQAKHIAWSEGRKISGGVNISVSSTHLGGNTFGRKELPFLQTIAFLKGDAAHPNEVYTAKSDGTGVTQLTHHNDPLISGLDLAKAENFTFKGADNDDVQGWLVRPPGFDPSKKYPVLFLIHGGPQGAWHDEWHARWNYQLFAAPGYVVVAVNPRGSTGFGQKFTDQISQDWTGRVYEDLMKGLDYALATYPFLDKDRMAAAGGSYGGFMVNWIEGHTDRFKALISHAGVFDTPSKYGTTEELWFPEWEFGGTPWDKPELYQKHNPAAFVKNFKTPMLVTHGALDYRVPEGQGMGLFTALQRQGVPSRLVLFPDEGHWILKPANRVVWWNEMHGWLARYLKEGGAKAR
ncbi:MAG: S9 family peptidase [Isosphaeraceae bacterium]